ncbi:MAG: exonuclease domain-containing protein [Actinomycetota bacterium]
MTTLFSVIDVETTGLRANDRVAEVAVVRVGTSGRIVDEWTTLVNPGRDLGPQYIHGIRARDLHDAPTFPDIAGLLLDRLATTYLVGHNVAFDIRMLNREFERVGGSRLPDGLCTMTLVQALDGGRRQGLQAVAPPSESGAGPDHSALQDARATARLFARCWDRLGPDERAQRLRSTTAVGLSPGRPAPVDTAVKPRGARTELEHAPVPSEMALVRRATGAIIAFTGDSGFALPDGRVIDRATATALATEHGFTVRADISHATSFVVAADVDTLSKRARAARTKGVPIVSEASFWAALGVRIQARTTAMRKTRAPRTPAASSGRSQGRSHDTAAAQDAILAVLRTASEPLGRSEILARAGLGTGDWIGAITALQERGLILREGAKRGTKYHVAR